MGIPYSRQINTAFDQVAPLVVQGFRVLETTKNIAVLLAWIQVVTVVLLALILAALVALLVTTNPDLADERRAFVTPALRALLYQGALVAWAVGGVVLFSAMVGGLYAALYGGKVEVAEMGEGAEGGADEGDAGKAG